MKNVPIYVVCAFLGVMAVFLLNLPAVGLSGVQLPYGWQDPDEAKEPDVVMEPICTGPNLELGTRTAPSCPSCEIVSPIGVPFVTKKPYSYTCYATNENSLALPLNYAVGAGLGLVTGWFVGKRLKPKGSQTKS